MTFCAHILHTPGFGLTVTVRAEPAHIVQPVVPWVTVDVVHLERELSAVPGLVLLALAAFVSAVLNEIGAGLAKPTTPLLDGSPPLVSLLTDIRAVFSVAVGSEIKELLRAVQTIR